MSSASSDSWICLEDPGFLPWGLMLSLQVKHIDRTPESTQSSILQTWVHAKQGDTWQVRQEPLRGIFSNSALEPLLVSKTKQNKKQWRVGGAAEQQE